MRRDLRQHAEDVGLISPFVVITGKIHGVVRELQRLSDPAGQ